MVENEYKYVVNKETFDKFLNLLEKSNLRRKDIAQVNYYYDTKDFYLYKNDSTVRVRQISGDLELQVKEPKSVCEFSCRNEYSEKVDRISDDLIINGNSYSLIGNLITHRTVFKIDEDTEIMFDMNYYYLVCDYEIEIEFTGKISSFTNDIILELNSNNLAKNSSKYKRYISEALKQKIKGIIVLAINDHKKEDIKDNTKLRNMGIDSIMYVQLIILIEKELNIKFPDDKLVLKNKTFKGLFDVVVELVKDKINQKEIQNEEAQN